MNMSKFIRLTKGLADRGILIKPEEINQYIKDPNHDYYTSTYFYDEKQLEEFKQRGNSVAGIKEVKTDQLWFDFDDKDNPEMARKDAIELVKRLKVAKIDDEAIQVYFSGNKGYNVVLKLNKEITPQQAENLALYKFGKDLSTLDHSLYDSTQLLRVPFTKHQKSGLFKIPLTTYDLEHENTDTIKEAARNIEMIERQTYKAVQADDDFYVMEEIAPKKELRKLEVKDYPFDINSKPKGWKMSKWAIAQGYFEKGERNEAMMVLLSTCRAMGYDKLGAYYMGKSALEKHKIRTGREDKFEKNELWDIAERIFSEEWEGGQYSDNHPLIKKICERLGLPNDSKSTITELNQAFNMFKNYAQNIEKLTVKTGIKALDDKIRMTVGMSVGVIASPGVGKCLGKGTPILMFDGSIKPVEEIQMGDQIMGDDSTPRNVLSICSGKEQLYKIHQTNGDDYIVNESHILSLKGGATFSPKARNPKYNYGKIYDIELLNYINGSKKQLKYLKGYKVPVEFNEKNIPLDPYLFGLWLGDGTSAKPEITVGKQDQQLLDLLKLYAHEMDLKYNIYKDRECFRFHFKKIKKTHGKNFMAQNLPIDKIIPTDYLINSRVNRLKLLAGLIDSDGYYSKTKGYYEITQKNQKLAEQIVFLCRSLGYRTTMTQSIKYCYYKGKKRKAKYSRIIFTAEDLTEIPTNLKRKQAVKINKQRYHDLTKITVEKLDIGDYYGFEIDGNKRFLLGDFTVTHNTSLALQMLNNMSKAGHKSIIFSYDMFHSMVFQKLIQKHLGIKAEIIFEKFKQNDLEFQQKCLDVLKREYGNVEFCFESGQNIEQIKSTIEEVQNKSGKQVRFIVVDYNELVLTDYSDPTQSSAFVAQKMRELANVYNLCVLSLFQPSKMSGDPSDEITSYRSAKGSSAIEQSVSVMFGISRPGFDPRSPENDRYITINCVKNRMGPIFALDLHWDGLTGTVRDLSPGEKMALDKLRAEKEESDDWDE